MSVFAVIDTETTWNDEVMSIGVVTADAKDFRLLDRRYYILTPFKYHGGMYTYALYAGNIRPDLESKRELIISELTAFLKNNKITSILAYNALFDYGHLPELSFFDWFDIMKIAAYRQYNSKIPEDADCFKTGRLKRGFGVESIYRMLSGDNSYQELHNALTDAKDELTIMKLLGVEFETYKSAQINKNKGDLK